ncbi:MAG: helicase C-terminal domain-containing protein [Promethearchaeota archaeon]
MLRGENEINYIDFFPYREYRFGQEKIIRQIEEATRANKIILLVAPNGAGKTIMALSALLPVALENNLKIIYMCRTHAQNTRVIKELIKISDLLIKKGLDIKISGLSIRGRNEMCLNKTLLSLKPNPSEAMSVCSDLRKNRNCIYFTNLLNKKKEVQGDSILIAPEIFEKPVDAEVLINFCKEKNLCPYFLSKFLLSSANIVICNYQWIFNPSIRESFLKFISKELRNCILVIDECHNIIDVATDVNSLKITPYSLRLCLKDLEIYNSPKIMQRFVKILIKMLENAKERINSEEQAINAESFLKDLLNKLGFKDLKGFENFLIELDDFGLAIHEEKLANGEISRDYLGHLTDFWFKWLKTYNLNNYFHCYTSKFKNNRKSISLEIVALEPREVITPILKECYSCLNLSGTVNPYVFNKLTGLNDSGKSYKGLIGESPFKKENIIALITEGVDTKRDNRTPQMFRKMVDKIYEVLYCTPANIGIFCASYKILKGLLENGLEDVVKSTNKKLFIEESGMSASENALLLEDFKSMASKSNINNGGVLLGVCGGRNSEGEDYPGDYMNSVIIAGFPYHLPTPRLEAKIKYYDEVFDKQGWLLAYLYPAIQRANQASGRPIRKATDKGSIIFMDRRFKDKAKWISEWIKNVLEIVPDKKNAIIQHLCPFWKY